MQPDAWTPGTDEKGPPGRLAVVAGAPRLTGVLGRSFDGLVGISATTGAYRFLDLPGAMPDETGMLGTDEPVALSPDGRQVAYWVGDEAAAGVAVYDTATGALKRMPIASAKGVAPEGLAWVSADTLMVRYNVILERTANSMSGRMAPTRLWTPATGRHTTLPVQSRLDDVAPTSEGFSSWDGTRLTLRSGSGSPTARFTVTGLDPQAPLGTLLVAPDGRRFAIVSNTGSRESQLYVGRLSESGRSVAVRPVMTTARAAAVVGWRDADHVLVQAGVGTTSGIYAVDVRSGTAERVVAVDSQNFTPGQVYAADLWSVPPVSRPAPPDVLGPQAVAALGAGAVLLALVALGLLVRRRRALA